MKDLSTLPTWMKFLIAIAYDLVDFFSIPGIGSLYDVIGIPLGIALWGPVGWLNAAELLDPSDQIDKFVPTMTIAGIISIMGISN